jgi:hypothetical protein
MKNKFTLLFAACASYFASQAQVVLNESFTATWTPSTANWIVQNNSAPVGTTTWFQGAPTTFTANSGGTADYYACNFNSQGSTAGGISNFLITPTLSIVNGATFQFATRTVNTPAFADRLQVLLSSGTGTGAIAAGTVAVGTFTTNLLDINPALTILTNSAVSNGTVNGYPNVWTVYTLTITGFPSATPGRFAFRYFVNDGGPNGANSDYIGVDDVKYTLPCSQPTIVITPPTASVCSGGTVSLVGSGATNYTWTPSGITTASATVAPTVTTIYTLTGTSTLGCAGTRTIQVTVTPTPTLAVNNVTVCSGVTTTLVASGATTYNWLPGGATTSSIVITPTASSVYTVTGNNGTCSNTRTVSVTIAAALSINVSASPSVVCAGSSSTLTASGAVTYSWLPGGASTSTIVVTPTASSVYTIGGSNGGCIGANTLALTVNPLPALTASANTGSVACVNGTVIITGGGATNYTWSLGAQSTTANPVSLTTGSVASSASLVLTGSTPAGCTATLSYVQVISLCTGINENSDITNTTVFPNPFTNELTVSGLSNGKVDVINALGQVVLSAEINDTKTINTEHLAKGIYFIKVKEGDSRAKTIKVIKE